MSDASAIQTSFWNVIRDKASLETLSEIAIQYGSQKTAKAIEDLTQKIPGDIDPVRLAQAYLITLGGGALHMTDDDLIGKAFASILVSDLKPELRDFAEIFRDAPRADADVFELLRHHRSVLAAGKVAQPLPECGLTPATIVDAIVAVSAALRRYSRRSGLSIGQAITIKEKQDGESNLSLSDLNAEVVAVTDLDQKTAGALLSWLLEVALGKPLLFEGFKMTSPQGDLRIIEFTSTGRRTKNVSDIIRLWSGGSE